MDNLLWLIYSSIFILTAGEILNDDIQNNIHSMVYNIPLEDHPPTVVKTDEVQFYYVDRTQKQPLLLNETNAHLIKPSKQVKCIIHGWQDNIQRIWLKDMTNAFLEKADYQIVQVEWKKLATVAYPESAQHTRGVGKILGGHIVKLGLDLQKVHLVGHSLGAQIAGFAGQEVQKLLSGKKVARISGLDVAGPLFEGTALDQRLDKTDADFVDVTHSDSGVTGYAGSIGTVDFWPNGGGGLQPGCPNNAGEQGIIYDLAVSTVFCSHFKSVEFFTESIKSSRFKATKCEGYFYYLVSWCSLGQKVVFGEDVSTNVSGNYYFQTKASKPYALG